VDESNLNESSSFSQDNSNINQSNIERHQINSAISRPQNNKINTENNFSNNKNFAANSESFNKKVSKYSDENASLIAKVNAKLNKDKEFKYKKLNQEMQDFCKLLDDYSRDNLIYKLNEKLRTNLNSATFNEIKELEMKINNSA